MNEKVQNFRDWFADYTSNYVVIGGTACSVLGDDLGFSFRSTKDIDLVLVNDQLGDAFSERFWKYIDEAGYSYRACSNGLPKLYRFQKPLNSGNFPDMIELFVGQEADLKLLSNHQLAHIEFDDAPSLSAIVLNENYYNILNRWHRIVDGLSILDTPGLILFKIKAWLDLSSGKFPTDSKDIKKHRRDVLELCDTLPSEAVFRIEESVLNDVLQFTSNMELEAVFTPDSKQKSRLDKAVSILRKAFIQDIH